MLCKAASLAIQTNFPCAPSRHKGFWTFISAALQKPPLSLRSRNGLSSFLVVQHEPAGLLYHCQIRRSFSSNNDNPTISNNNNETKASSLSVAIVGAGPSGMYTAKYLRLALQKYSWTAIPNISSVDIDVLDRLPTPYGLVRSGVAPDHPEVKNVENDFASLFVLSPLDMTVKEAASRTSCTIEFRGNVNVGHDVSLSELSSLYDIVVLSYGCQADRTLGIQGESSLKGILSAREFVGWYNGHPDCVHVGDEVIDVLSRLKNKDNAQVVVIGQGNVALDCARILAKGKKGLFETDIAAHALSVLQDGVQRTTVLGRRGHVQGAFTIKELRELTKLVEEGHDTRFIVYEEELDKGTTAASTEELQGPAARPKVRIDKLFRSAVAQVSKGSSVTNKKEIILRFLLNPRQFKPNPADLDYLGSVVCERTELKGEAGRQVAVGTGLTEEIPATLALVSIGYKAIPLPDMDESIFDHSKGIIRNLNGKVMTSDVEPVKGLFVSGWLKRGPSGIIGTNIVDAKETVASIMHDLPTIVTGEMSAFRSKRGLYGRNGLDRLIKERGIRAINWDHYQVIDTAEKDPTRLRSKAQPREKFVVVEEMLKLLQ